MVRQLLLVLPALNRAYPLPTVAILSITAGPGVFWMTEVLDIKKVPQCYSSLNSVVFTTHKTNIPVDPTASIVQLGPQCTQDYANGFFIDYSTQKWDEWRRTFEHQTGVMLKLCTGINTNKEASTGVLKMGAHAVQYTVGWRLQYTCFRGGQPRYKESEQTKSHAMLHDTTIYALVQILTEVAFPEQETKYNLSLLKQSQSYRNPRYQVPSYLEGRPHQVQSLCMLNIERAKSIPKPNITEVDEGVFKIQSRDNKSWSITLLTKEPAHVQHLSPPIFHASTSSQFSSIFPHGARMTC